jgi:3D (Asp-Asp-Asp) domain-containing protein
MLKTISAVMLFSVLCSCATASLHLKKQTNESNSIERNDPLAKDTFSFREPTINDLSKKVTLWATYYYLPQMSDNSGTLALRDMQSSELGPRLNLKDWCNSALEGSVRIVNKDGDAKTFNYAGVTTDNPVDCKKIFKFDVSKTKFREAHGPYGDGIDNLILAPYRTLATDLGRIPTGTVLYVPAARGAKITLDSGRVIIHDGYFFAGDKGGAIKENHIDVFIGTHSSAPFFPWIKSNQEKTFEAYIVTDKKIISDLTELHAQ